MRRWTDLQKEMNGYKRKLANKKHEVSLKEAPWEEEEDEDTDLRDADNDAARLET